MVQYYYSYVYSSEKFSPYYDVDVSNHGNCFYELVDLYCSDLNNIIDTFTVSFKNNSARNGGEHIFGAFYSVFSDCNVCPEETGILIAAANGGHNFIFSQPQIFTFTPISSHPSRVCLCDHDSQVYTPHYFCSNTSLIFLSRSVHPGEEFNFEAVLVGAEFGTGTGSVYAQFLFQSSSILYPPHQYSQRV